MLTGRYSEHRSGAGSHEGCGKGVWQDVRKGGILGRRTETGLLQWRGWRLLLVLKLLAHLKPRTGAAVWGMLLEGADLLRSIVGGDRLCSRP